MSNEDLDKIDPRYIGAFLEAGDLMERDFYTLTIDSIAKPDTEKDSAGKKIDKYVIGFKEARKRLIVNKTNFKMFTAALGKKLSGWIGKRIDLEVRVLKEAFGEKNVPVIRVRMPDGVEIPFGCRKHVGKPFEHKRQPAPAQKPAPAAAPLLDDRKPAVPETKPVSVGKSDPEMVQAIKEVIAERVAAEIVPDEKTAAETWLVFTKNGKPVSAPSADWFLAGTTEEDRINRHDWLVEVYTALIQP